MIQLFSLLAGVMLFFLVAPSTYSQMSSSNYQITSDVVGVSGDESGSSANFGIRDTIGEPIAEASSSTSANFGVASGFRQAQKGQTLTFSLGASSVDFGNLSTSAASTQSHTMIITDDNRIFVSHFHFLYPYTLWYIKHFNGIFIHKVVVNFSFDLPRSISRLRLPLLLSYTPH